MNTAQKIELLKIAIDIVKSNPQKYRFNSENILKVYKEFTTVL